MSEATNSHSWRARWPRIRYSTGSEFSADDGLPLLGAGGEAEVFAKTGNTVIKRYRIKGDYARTRVLAETEVLKRLAETAAQRPPSVRFPALVESRPAEGEIEMERAPGTTVQSVTETGQVPPGLSKCVAQGLVFYIAATGRGYQDLTPNNLIWDPGSNDVWFIDVAEDPILPEPATDEMKLSFSLGSYLGSVAYESARPGYVGLLVRRRQLHFLGQIADCLRDLGFGIERREILRSARAHYDYPARDGGVARRLYYATVGASIAGLVMAAGLLVTRSR